ncbi:oligosaccharide flippase family protein [Mycolicibacterium sp. 050158]|uniref:oligosaccharide flippase family protein n=1 Tax=Mycolicibacterium sp. 050158 TaxID=3090602 RepID=UPI00299DBB9B|nr:oligosaccharide flippase family protein [Mycolicibacterium sp. 050158]MDX1888203.1 oligosaccharide flippase family protein [Mycolicibacterium sp. 050158]
MRSSFVYTAISIASRLLVSTLLFVLLARVWGPERFGTFSFVFSSSALLMLIVDFGFTTFLLREVAADPGNVAALIGRGLPVKYLLTAVMSTVAVGLAVGLGPSVLPPVLFVLLLLAALLLSFAEYFITPLRAIGRYDVEALLATTGNAVQFALSGGCAWLGGSPVHVAAAIVTARLLYLSASILAARRLLRPLSWRPLSRDLRGTVRAAWPYGVDGALTSAWSFIDVVAVRVLFGVHAVGLYAAGQKIVQGVVALAPLVGNVMIPQLARKASTRASDTWRSAGAAAIGMFGIGFIFALPLIILPTWTTNVLFGSDFDMLSQWLPWFGAILLVRFSGAGFGVVLTAIGLQKKRVIGQLAALSCYVAFVVAIGVRHLGVEAALGALLLAMSVMGATYAVYLWLARAHDYLGLDAPLRPEGPVDDRSDSLRLTRSSWESRRKP